MAIIKTISIGPLSSEGTSITKIQNKVGRFTFSVNLSELEYGEEYHVTGTCKSIGVNRSTWATSTIDTMWVASESNAIPFSSTRASDITSFTVTKENLYVTMPISGYSSDQGIKVKELSLTFTLEKKAPNIVVYGEKVIIDLTGTTATSANIVSGYGAYGSDGAWMDGTIEERNSDDLTVSGATVTTPAGYYASQATKSVATATAQTPVATKGTVSNHSVSVTPSVTHAEGYISGGTKTGTAVTVSASELVSGTYSVTGSGTHNVTNYASASVAAGSEGTPKATKGSVSNHSISVTPSVSNTAGYISGGTKNGTAVTVSASELVSGSQTITSNGTTDVTNLASVTVDIPFVTYYTGSTDPSASLGNDGDIYLKVVE